MVIGPIDATLLLIFAAWVGGGIPLLFERSHGRLMQFLSLASGFFLGSVFLHLLPELAGEIGGALSPWAWMLGGLLLLVVLDLVLIGRQGHAMVGWGALLGLSFHSLAAGMGLGVLLEEGFGSWIFLGLALHKVGEAFSLASAMRLVLEKRKSLLLVVFGFSLVLPLGLFVGLGLKESLSHRGGQILSALSAGSFLYVAVGHLLPEVFHEKGGRLAKVLFLLFGVSLAAIPLLFGEAPS
jgi:zinc transporter ZupT